MIGTRQMALDLSAAVGALKGATMEEEESPQTRAAATPRQSVYS
jgi:hypothetical protein